MRRGKLNVNAKHAFIDIQVSRVQKVLTEVYELSKLKIPNRNKRHNLQCENVNSNKGNKIYLIG